MGLLRWVEADVGTSNKFLKAEIVNLHIDFMDLCEGRFWGGHDFYFQLKFSIHERIVKSNGWNYQLLAPNGIHVYCRDIEEAKELAEVMYKRIITALFEQTRPVDVPVVQEEGEIAKKLNKAMESTKQIVENLNVALYRKFCKNTKHKTEKLLSLIKERGIEGRIYFSRLRNSYGWMFSSGFEAFLIGSNYQKALSAIQGGSLDFYKEENNECETQEIIHIGEVG